jgi:chromosome segregation ATPase
MQIHEDPEFLEALQKIFATRNDIRAIADYQQKLYTSLSELNSSHRSVHDHVRRLSDSHTRGEGNTETLLRAREDLERLLRNLEQAHGQTQSEIRRAAQELNLMQQEVRKVSQLEQRLERLEREVREMQQEERKDDRQDDDQDQRLRRLESRR